MSDKSLEELHETISQLTELVREYRNGKYHMGCRGADTRCPLCIKADLLLKENK